MYFVDDSLGWTVDGLEDLIPKGCSILSTRMLDIHSSASQAFTIQLNQLEFHSRTILSFFL